MQLQDFIAKYNGKFLTVTGPDSGQCTAVAHAWQREGWNGSIVYGDAKDTYSNARQAGYVVSPYTSGLIPAPGWVAVMDGTVGGGAGHTYVVVGADNRTITGFSQNDPYNTPAQVRTFTYEHLIGFYYPEGDDMDKVSPAVVDMLRLLGLTRHANEGEIAGQAGKPLSEAWLLQFGNAMLQSQERKDNVDAKLRYADSHLPDISVFGKPWGPK